MYYIAAQDDITFELKLLTKDFISRQLYGVWRTLALDPTMTWRSVIAGNKLSDIQSHSYLTNELNWTELGRTQVNYEMWMD